MQTTIISFILWRPWKYYMPIDQKTYYYGLGNIKVFDIISISTLQHVFTLSGRLYTWIHLLKMIIPWWENLKKWRQYLCLYHSWIVELVFSMSMNSRHVLNHTCVICFPSFCNSDESRVYNKSFAGRVCECLYPNRLEAGKQPHPGRTDRYSVGGNWRKKPSRQFCA